MLTNLCVRFNLCIISNNEIFLYNNATSAYEKRSQRLSHRGFGKKLMRPSAKALGMNKFDGFGCSHLDFNKGDI